MKEKRPKNDIRTRKIAGLASLILLYCILNRPNPARKYLNSNTDISAECSRRSTGRHAYLIIAHNKLTQLELLMQLLDDKQNDIYVMMDKKTGSIPLKAFQSGLTFSNLTFTERISITWGTYSLVNAELILLKSATQKHYDYYHLLSGSDLPLKAQHTIHHFFKAHYGENFIIPGCSLNRCFRERLDYYHLFPQYVYSRNHHRFSHTLKWINKKLVLLQKAFGVSRLKKDAGLFYKGRQWFSITDCFARFVLQKRDFIEHFFKYTIVPDEEFIQTILMNSPFRDTLSSIDVRLIDWKHPSYGGVPRIWTVDDYTTLMNTDRLFGRKFDIDREPILLRAISNAIRKNQSTIQ